MWYKLKKCLPVLLFAGCMACGHSSTDNSGLQRQVDTLQRRLDNVYKPGLGEFMYGIQVHHAKLWFAGAAQNWKLADFELNEINEAVDDVRKYCADRPEVSSIGMIAAPLDSIHGAIQNRNADAFKRSFVLLTNTCNSCHHATGHEFNVIKVPDMQQFSNQEFKPQQ